MKNNSQAGYIAVTSVIIMSLLLITITAALSTANYFSRFNILESEYKERSNGLAEACVDQARYNIAQNIPYTGDVTVTGVSKCTIVDVIMAGSNKIIKAQGMYQKSYTNLQVEVKASDLSTVSWQEVPNF